MLPNIWYYFGERHSHTKNEIVPKNPKQHFTHRLMGSMKLSRPLIPESQRPKSLKDKTFIWNESIAGKKG